MSVFTLVFLLMGINKDNCMLSCEYVINIKHVVTGSQNKYV